MAACGMFSGVGTGYKNLRLAEPGAFIEVETLSGNVNSMRISGPARGLTRSEPDPDAATKAHAAIKDWMRELGFLNSGKLRLHLSGGRDSRVVGAALPRFRSGL